MINTVLGSENHIPGTADLVMQFLRHEDRRLGRGKLRRNDVVMTTRGTIGNIGLYGDDVPYNNVRVNSGMLILRPNRRTLMPEFLFELLRSDFVRDQIRRYATGTAQPHLPIKTLVSFSIPVPNNLEDQRALVKTLRAVEPETQRLQCVYERKLASLEELKQSILHRAFTGDL